MPLLFKTFKTKSTALASAAQSVGVSSHNRKEFDSRLGHMPGLRGRCRPWARGPIPGPGAYGSQRIAASISH